MFRSILTILKVILAIVVLPITIALSIALHEHLSVYPSDVSIFFIYGLCTYVLVHLFVHQFYGFFEFSHKVLTSLLQFAAPFDKWLSYATPTYTIMILMVFYIVRVLGQVEVMDESFSFLAGFTIGLHLIVLSQELQSREKTVLKPNHLFALSFIYMFNVCLVVLLFDLVFQIWSFGDFAHLSVEHLKSLYGDIYEAIWPQ